MERSVRWEFAATMGLFVLMAVAYPLFQAVSTGGYLFYTNGFDEATYLQFDFSRQVQGLARPGQYLVSLGHVGGLSGGWLNAIFDVLALLGFGWLCRAIFCELGWTDAQAAIGALSLFTLPLIYSGTNPVVKWLFDWNVRSGMIYWINLPEVNTPGILRTPEPQFSLVLLAAGIFIALRCKSYWPVYACLPIMYPFVAIPTAFVALACDGRSHWSALQSRWADLGALVFAFVAIGSATAAYYSMLVGEKVRSALIDSHLPLLSCSSLIALIAYALLRGWIAEPLRFLALALALAPMAASNHQLVSGHIAQPDNFENYVGSLVIAVILVLAFNTHVRLRHLACAMGLCLFARSSYVSFRINQITNVRIELSPALLAALRDDPAHTVIQDLPLATVLNMVYPRQGSTALGVEKTFGTMAPLYVPAYRCIKRQILSDHPGDASFAKTLAHLDNLYTFGGQDLPHLSLYRKRQLIRYFDLDIAGCQDPDGRPLKYFYVH